MIDKIKKFLNQPYPFDYDFEKVVKGAAGCGLFVFLFLYIFDPFGKQENIIPFIENIILVGYGLITFIILFIAGLIFIYFIPSVFNEENWKIKNEILASIIILILIGLANAVYNGIFDVKPFSIELFLRFQFYTFFVGFFPTLFFIIMEQYWKLKKNLKAVYKINANLDNSRIRYHKNITDDESIILTSDNDKEELKIKYTNLLFIKSVGNYIEVYFKNGDKIDSQILRSSLKRIEDILNDNSYICRSHRAYLVNIGNISSVYGNSQGYQLEFEDIDKSVPVSRKYAKNIQEFIAQ